MKIEWIKKEGTLGECLMTPERYKELEKFVVDRINIGTDKIALIEDLEERNDLSFNEWLAIIYALGYYEGQFRE